MNIYVPMSFRIWLLRSRDGKREASRWMWFLIFLLPAGFLCATVWLTFSSLWIDATATRTTGEVVRVYKWQDWNPWDGETTVYSPVFRYKFTDDSMTEASAGQSSPNWNYEVGSTHKILYFPRRKGDVILDNFEAMWALPLAILGIGLVCLLPSLLGALLLLRWLKGGKTGEPAGV
jgi:hypothetical protein